MEHEDDVLYITAEEDGSFFTNEYAISSLDFGELFHLIATDESGVSAENYFTDAISLQGTTEIEACSGEVISFSAKTTGQGGTSILLNWQVSTNGDSGAGGNWTDLANDATYSGVTTANISIITNVSLDGYYYRVRGTVGGVTAYTGVATLNVNSAPAIFDVGYDVASLCGGYFQVTLSGSESGVSYTLKAQNNPNIETLPGDGNPLEFTAWVTDPNDAKTYYVEAYDASKTCTTINMNGEAKVTNASSPAAFNVTGGGAICQNTQQSYDIGIDGSETGVSYQVYYDDGNGAVPVGTPMEGTGAAITDLYTASDEGTYNVLGTKTSGNPCVTEMIGSASISVDLIAPVITVPSGELAMECFNVSAVTTWAETASALDNLDGVVDVSYYYTAPTDNCDEIVTVTFSAIDACENTGTATKNFTVDDQTEPSLTEDPFSDLTDYDACKAGAQAAVPPFSETSAILGYSDNCGQNVTVSLDSTKTSGDDCDWTVTYYYTVFDECLNPLEVQTYSHSGSDQTEPSLTVDPFSDLTDYDACKAGAQAAVPPFSETSAILGYSDNCGQNVTGSLDSTKTSGDDCDWTVTYYYTVFDECLNPLEVQTYSHSGSDQTAPSLTGTAFTDSTEYNACMTDAQDSVPAWSESNALMGYSDNCGQEVSASLDSTRTTGSDCDWTVTYHYTVFDECNNPLAEQAYSHNGSDQTAPILTCPEVEAYYETDDTSHCKGAALEFEALADDNCGTPTIVYLIGEDTITFPYFFPVGTTTVDVIASDECGNESEPCSFDVVVKIPTETRALVSSEVARYQDEVTLYAEVIGECSDKDLQGVVKFYLDGDSVGVADAFPIPYNEPGNPDTLRATYIYKIDKLPKVIDLNKPYGEGDSVEVALYSVTAEFIPDPLISPDYLGSQDDTSLYIYPRKVDPFDAVSGFYAGTILAWTTGSNSSTGTITMAAMLKDNNEPIGDLRGAKVTFCFVEEGVLKPIPSAKNLPVSLVNMTDGTIGAASADVQVDISKSDAKPFEIAILVTGGYYNDPSASESRAFVTVAKPVAGGSIMGGGNLLNTNSEGQIKGAFEKLTWFEFDVKYNKKKTNPQGKMTIKVWSWYKPDGTLDNVLHHYEISSNAINLMVLGPNEKGGLNVKQAIFDAKANLSEIFVDSVATVDGNSPLHVTLTDSINPGDKDSIAITYYNSSGGIWFSSHFAWANARDEVTLEQELYDGEIVVKGDGSEPEGSTPKPGKNKSAEIATAIEPEVEFADLKVYPNPFADRLSFEFGSPETVHAKIDIYDMTGRMVQTIFDSPVEGGAMYNADFTPTTEISAFYIYRMTLGDAIKNGRVVYKAK